MKIDSITYKNYIQSDVWQATRKRYWNSNMPKNCFICGIPRHKGMHLHHRTYKRFGHERLIDLVPVCQLCHTLIHQVWDTATPNQRRKGLWHITSRIKSQYKRSNI